VECFLAPDRTEAEVEDARAQLVSDPRDLRQNPVRAADEELAQLDTLVQRAQLEACLLPLRVAAVVAGFCRRLVEGAVTERERVAGGPAGVAAVRSAIACSSVSATCTWTR
jgi:hypothetical protein